MSPSFDPRPVVFLDVDGPLIPFGATPEQRPPGHPTRDADGGHPLLGRIDRDLGPLLRELPAQLVWATTWGEEANEVVAPLLGLDRLDVVQFTDGIAAPSDVHWKTPDLVGWAGDRPFVWLDDELTEADRWWVGASRAAPARLVRVDHRVGLTSNDLADVAGWLHGLPDRRPS